jgi:hypothetical protein
MDPDGQNVKHHIPALSIGFCEELLRADRRHRNRQDIQKVRGNNSEETTVAAIRTILGELREHATEAEQAAAEAKSRPLDQG